MYFELLKMFYNVAFIYLISPGWFKIESNALFVFKKPRIVFQVFLGLFQIWTTVVPFISHFSKDNADFWSTWGNASFSKAFSIAHLSLWDIINVNVIAMFWMQGQGLASILNKVNVIEGALLGAGLSQSRAKKIFTKTLFVLIIGLVLLWSCNTHFLLFGQIHKRSYALYVREEFCELQLVNCSATNSGLGPGLTGFPVHYILLAALFLVGNFLGILVSSFVVMIPLAHALTLYFLVTDFVDLLHKPETKSANGLVLDIFTDLCELSEMLNDAFGTVVALSCIQNFLVFASFFTTISVHGWPMILEMCIYVSAIVAFMVLAADANSKIGYLSYWFQKKTLDKGNLDSGKDLGIKVLHIDWENPGLNHQNEQLHISLALHQLETNQVGIRCRAFTVTYGFVGGMVVLWLNYAILYYQLETTHPEK